jgi:uncharacterized protein (DUF58 family)
MKTSPPEPTAKSASSGASAEQLLKRLEWTVLRRLDGLLQGDYRTLLRGTGMDLADLREYQHHDDVRHIDWNVTARLEIPHVRVFTEDREMSAWFLLDLSPSMDFGSSEQRKRNVSADFVAVLARMLTRHGNRVGAMLYGSGVDAVIPARGGRNHVLHLLHTLQARPEATTLGPTRLHELLESAANLVRRRSTVFVVPDLGLIPIRDVETGEQLLVDTHDAGFRKRFAQIAAQREADLRQSLARAGVDTLELSTDGDLVDAIMRFTELRKRRSRASGGAMPAHLRHAA